MPEYIIGIHCVSENWCDRYPNACEEKKFLVVRSNAPLTSEEIGKLNGRYRIPNCDYTGCDKFLENRCTEVSGVDPNRVLRLEELERK